MVRQRILESLKRLISSGKTITFEQAKKVLSDITQDEFDTLARG